MQPNATHGPGDVTVPGSPLAGGDQALATALLGERLIDLRSVEQKAGIKHSAIYERMARGTFPVSVAIDDDNGDGGVRWLYSEIDAWVRSRPRRGTRQRS
jgi:predicted DNA-binding transcriptional regulator AlpA